MAGERNAMCESAYNIVKQIQYVEPQKDIAAIAIMIHLSV